MGRYGDEIRRITRQQGGAPEPEPPSGDPGHDGPRASGGRGPLIALVVVVLLAGVGWILVRQMMDDSKLQDCVMSGRKNCVPSGVDSAGP